jgi:hypothetical protein
MTDPVAEAKTLLAGATPGPWSLNQPDYSVIVLRGDGYTLLRAPTHRDAALIAATPRLLAALVAEVERLREELDAAQLRSIEARNPGIDMEEVKAHRAEQANV